VITAGIDAGAATTKAVLVSGRDILGYRIANTAFDFLTTARYIFDQVVSASLVSGEQVGKVCATGYGRASIAFANMTVSEISAHARGVHLYLPEVRGIIDVGGQDSKVIALENGRITDFLMNDKCAAGTGKFLEYTARALEVPIGELGSLALTARYPVVITSMCTVFAESEVLSLRAQGISRQDIAAGLITNIAARIVAMTRRIHLKDPIAFVGGVAKNPAMRKALEKELRVSLFVPDEPQITGAVGAALYAQEKSAEDPTEKESYHPVL
jgi:predicted CoA-substrate-specific enzyme activase